MAEILLDFTIKVPIEKVFEAVTTGNGLDKWWTETSSGDPVVGATFELYFGPEYNWTAEVSKYNMNRQFELRMVISDADWTGTRIGFTFIDNNPNTEVQFYHRGWKEANKHFKISTFCWAMYLRCLKRYLEFGEEVKYELRLEV